jgi:hypothetical protein
MVAPAGAFGRVRADPLDSCRGLAGVVDWIAGIKFSFFRFSPWPLESVREIISK